ncbi:MAG: TraR/DksA family transcriptional regulator [Candidatus Komeilibacteria bacterium]
MNTTLVEIPESPKSTLNVEQLSSLMSEAFTELERKGQDVESLVSSFKVQDDGSSPNSGEIAERAQRCPDNQIATIRADNHCHLVNKLTETIINIRKGEYDDHCTECGEIIPFGRLMSVPSTTKCVPCKEKKI